MKITKETFNQISSIPHSKHNKDIDKLLSFVWFYSQQKEVWKEIPGYYGKYFVSSLGRVLSLHNNLPRILKQYRCQDGYLYVDLNGDKRVHRLVAKAFIPNPYNKAEVHHIDLNRTNNAASNLMWVTTQEHRKLHAELARRKKSK